MTAEITVGLARHHQPGMRKLKSRLPRSNRMVEKAVAGRTLRRSRLRGAFDIGGLIDDTIGHQLHQRDLAALSLDLATDVDEEAGALIGVAFIIGGTAEFKLPGMLQLMDEDAEAFLGWRFGCDPERAGFPVSKSCLLFSLIVDERFLRDPHRIGPRANFEDHPDTLPKHEQEAKAKLSSL